MKHLILRYAILVLVLLVGRANADDFLKSSPLDERVFKVLKDAVAPPKPKTFVSLTTLK